MADIKAVIFDMDGVITDTEKLLVKYWCKAAGDMGYPMTREQALELRSLAARYAEPYLKEQFGEDFNYRKVRARRKELMDDHIDLFGVDIKPGLKELIGYLKENGYKLAVATATDYDRAVSYLQKAGVYECLDALCCGPSVEHGKPEPDIYLYAANKLGVEPEECLAVEDSPNGVKAAYAANMYTVMIPDLTQPDEELKKLIYRKCDDLLEIIGVLETFRQTFF
ncbi:MAG: HAD family phosphatase [Oscillospiraceae bacterium]|nr:HAD family phosphatase [Oscillospiraceae bacterium]